MSAIIAPNGVKIKSASQRRFVVVQQSRNADQVERARVVKRSDSKQVAREAASKVSRAFVWDQVEARIVWPV